jgi:flagellar motility protein MotE (MotC chaperone)
MSPGGATVEELARREFEIQRREQQLDTREDAIRQLEADVNRRVREAEAAEGQVQELLARNDAILAEQRSVREDQQKRDDALKSERVEHLVAAFKGMKPEQAGNLINSMDDAVAVAILSAMPGSNAGKILAMVSPDKAARLVKAISEQRVDPRVLLEQTQMPGAGT